MAFELGWLHDRKITGLLALENATGVATRFVISAGQAGAVAHQATSHDMVTEIEDRGDGVLPRKRDDLTPAPAIRVCKPLGVGQKKSQASWLFKCFERHQCQPRVRTDRFGAWRW